MPLTRSLLLYGTAGTGKTMLAHAVAHCAGACFLDISPRRLDGKFPGKEIGMAMHIVFKVARSLAPTVIYIDEVEKVSNTFPLPSASTLCQRKVTTLG